MESPIALTPAALTATLHNVVSAKNEVDCATALVSAASLIQEAVLSNLDAEEFRKILSACPDSLNGVLGQALDRAVNFHVTDEGTLGLWLIPVVLSSSKALQARIALENASMNGLRLLGSVNQQMGLSSDKLGDGRLGWSYLIPALYDVNQVRGADLGDLIRLPQHARQAVQGSRESVKFLAGESADKLEPGVSLYFLPMVAFHPAGVAISIPAESERTGYRLTQWIKDTLTPSIGTDFYVRAALRPQPFSVALDVGERLRLEANLREIMGRVCIERGVEPNGMSALVAPYAVRQLNGQLMLGVSLVSRLTGGTMATVSLPVETKTGAEEVDLVTHVLKDMGMHCVQDRSEPIPTIACQHCGGVQFAMPSPECAAHGMAEASRSLQ